MRALFLLPYSHEAPCCRFRVHQFIPYLESHGVRCDLRELVTQPLYDILYKPGRRFRKAALFSRRAVTRIKDLADARHYDVLFVHRECFPFGPAFMERYLRTLGPPIVYDFDDAIYMLPYGGKLKELIRVPEKTNVISRLADEVVVCNEHLRAFAAAYNRNVTLIPTSVDTDQFLPRANADVVTPPSATNRIRLGWIGSHSTAPYLNRIKGALRRVASRFPIEFLVVGAGPNVDVPGVEVINRPWRLDSEIAEFQSLDIGVYPLEDDIWELGKTGFKTIQYMAVGVPGVISRIGASKTIVQEGVNGFLADSEDEWVEKLCRLCEDPALRRRVGAEGRRTAVAGFSITANAPKLLEVIERAASRRAR